MKKGKDLSAKIDGLYLVHQNIPGKKTKPIQYNQHILFIPLQGEISIEVSMKQIHFGLGHMFYLSPNTLHTFSSSENFGERLIIMLDKKNLNFKSHIPEYIKLPLNQFIKELLFYLLLHPTSKSAKALITIFSDTLKEAIESTSKAKSFDKDLILGKVMDSRVKKTLTYMQENISESMSTEYLAKKFGLSSRNFNRLVLKETGIQPRQWLIHLRIEKAKELLKIPGASVTDVTYSVGYGSLSQFIAAFRSRTGQLPSEFIRNG